MSRLGRSGPLAVEGAVTAGPPGVGVFPGDEVAALVVGLDVDVVEPVGLRTGLERPDALVGGVGAGRVLGGDEGGANRGLDDRGAVVGGGPGVAVGVRVVAHRRGDGVVYPVDRGVGQHVVL